MLRRIPICLIEFEVMEKKPKKIRYDFFRKRLISINELVFTVSIDEALPNLFFTENASLASTNWIIRLALMNCVLQKTPRIGFYSLNSGYNHNFFSKLLKRRYA